MAHATLTFPSDFRWGTATAAYHVEGQNSNSDWWPWEEAGHILQNHRSGLACNWWDLDVALTDLDTAAEMGTNAHRLSVEWARIEPEPSVFDQTALDQYRALLEGMHERGIEPMVTLHHFTNPRWFVEKGDLHSQVGVDYFQRFVQRVVQSLGDLIPKWVTINEPMVYVAMRYLSKAFPQPKQRSSWPHGRRWLYYSLRAHAVAYHTIKDAYPEAQVGVSKQIIPFKPWTDNGRMAQWWAKRVDWIFNRVFMNAIASGRPHRILGGGRIPHLANSLDFMGINYYSPRYLKFGSLSWDAWPPGKVLSDTGYGEIYPAGLTEAIKIGLTYNKPIYITENGIPDADDIQRPAYLISQLREVWRAIMFSYPIMGYYHWSLIDNFEWDRGWTQRFGLLGLDPETQERWLRPSGHLYGEICRGRAVSSYMAERYAPDLLPQLFPGQAPIVSK